MKTDKKLSLLDRYLTLIIFIVMAAGAGICYLTPSLAKPIAGMRRTTLLFSRRSAG